MKQLQIFITVFALFILGCNQKGMDGDVEIASKIDSVSYSIGLDIGKNLKQQGIDIEPPALLLGLKHAISDTSLLSDDEIRVVLTNLQKDMMEARQEKNKLAAEKNKSEADAFFAENKNKPDVITLDSGLQYKVLKSGNGKSPKLSSSVDVHYKGTLIDGKEFDSSYKRGKPATFKVTGVIKGWTEILQLMKEGDKWEVYIPSDLAYGMQGSGPDIGPNAALIFEMELLKVN